MDQPFNAHANINIYSNAPYTPFRTVEHFPLLPIWIVGMDANWKLYGGPVSDTSELPLIIFDRCTVIVNAITGDIIRVDFPMVE